MRMTGRIASIALALLLVAVASSAAEPFTAKALMETLAQNKGSRADFVEKKYLASVDRPIESSGELI